MIIWSERIGAIFADAYADANAYGDDDCDDVVYLYAAHPSLKLQKNLKGNACVCYASSDIYHHLNFPMNLTRDLFACFSYVSFSLISTTYPHQKMTLLLDDHSIQDLIVMNYYACSYPTSS